MHKCKCGTEFGAPATLRIHQNKEHTLTKRVVSKAKKVVKKVAKRK